MTHMTAIHKIVKKLTLKNGDVLAIVRDSWIDEDTEALKNAIDELGVKVLILKVNDLSEVRNMTVSDMNSAGWFRREQLSTVFRDMFKNVKKVNRSIKTPEVVNDEQQQEQT